MRRPMRARISRKSSRRGISCNPGGTPAFSCTKFPQTSDNVRSRRPGPGVELHVVPRAPADPATAPPSKQLTFARARTPGASLTTCARVPELRVEPFTVEIPERTLSDLRERIRNTRWPAPSPEPGWEQGAELKYTRDLLGYWADGFDWREQERRLNEHDHFLADVDGVRIHFVHVRRGGIPLILSHGWPSTFVEHLQLVPHLDGFDLVIPSLPGYGFSDRPPRTTMRETGKRWHTLMQGLGYERYGAQGGDFGAAVTAFMALDRPEPLLGIHLHQIDTPPHVDAPSTDAEREYLEAVAAWDAVERGYSSIQSTKPQTVAYGLNDSPAGLAAWLIEKWRSWSHDLERIDRDVLLTNLTIFWATETIAASMRDYYDTRWHGHTMGPDDRIEVPTAVAVFANELVSEGTPPREWAERLFNSARWTPMPRGGHFAPAEEPALLAGDIAEFFSGLP
jgi:pimeloyl-ACP methyl ester carboxylesterase